MTNEQKYGQTLDDMAEYLNILYYGEPGSGKTSAAAGMARLGPVYLVDVESGAKARPLRRLGIPTKNIRPVQITGYQDLDRFYWHLKQELEDDPGSVVGVIFDSITEIHDQLIREQVDIRHAKAVRKVTNKNGELLQAVDDNEFEVQLPERGIVTEQLRTLTRRFRDLPCHLAVVAGAKREVDPNGEGVVYLPLLPPKYGAQIRGFVDVVSYTLKVSEVEDASGYLGVFRDTGKYKGKDRLGAIPPVMANPSFDRLASVIFEEIDLSTDEDQATYWDRVRAARPEPDPTPADPTEERPTP